MKNNNSTKQVLVLVAIIVVTIMIIWGYQSAKNIAPESPDTITLSQGTQARFEGLAIGLSNIDGNSAWLSIHQEGAEGSADKQVIAGDTVNIYGYKIEIKSVNKAYNFSLKSGSSHGNVNLIIKKQ